MNYENLKKLEDLVEAFLNAEEANREKALALMSEQERKTFLEYVGFYRLMTYDRYYKSVLKSLSDTMYEEFNK